MSPRQLPTPRPLLPEVERFRAWAAEHTAGPHSAEWECDYPDWENLYAAVLGFVATRPIGTWSTEELDAVLYSVARDNEDHYLSEEIADRHPALLLDLAEAAVPADEAEGKWQLAYELGQSEREPERRDAVLLKLARDENEYVRRRSLGALTRVKAATTEAVALEAWAHPDVYHEYSKMMALTALAYIGSSHLEHYLMEAERDTRQYLVAAAARIRSGDLGTL